MSANFTGIWHADLSRSRLLTMSPAALKMTINQTGDQLRQETVITRQDGTEQCHSFQCGTTGEGDALFNNAPLRGNVRWVGEELMIELWAQVAGREMHLCDYWSLSPDGNTLTMEHRGDDLDGQITVLNRAEHQSM